MPYSNDTWLMWLLLFVVCIFFYWIQECLLCEVVV